MAATPTVTPAPWSHAISDRDHGPLVSITTSLMLASTVLFLIIRLSIRWPWKKMIGWDDTTTAIGSLLAVGQSIAVFQAVHYGLGRYESDVDASALESMEKAIFAGDILFIFTLTASKLAVALLLLRLSRDSKSITSTYVLMGSIGVWGLASLLAVAVRPSIATPWRIDRPNATDIMNLWTGVGAVGALLDIGLIALPVLLVLSLQMPFKAKMTVISGFALRTPVLIVCILRIVAFRTTLSDTANISWRYAWLEMYTEIEMHFSLIAATIPCMHVFLKNFNTGYLGTTADQIDPTATMAGSKGSNSYVMSSMGGRNTKGSAIQTSRERKSVAHAGVGHGGMGASVGVSANDMAYGRGDINTDAESVTSDGSDKIIVRRTVNVDWG